MNKKKLDVHMVQHTHWDREWYFTSDDSRTMLYYDMKFVIEYLENNDDVFTFDGQSSVIDDFLMFAPDWTDRFKAVIKAKKLLVGPYYTQTDNTLPSGESIVRNIEIGNKLAKDMGHSMQVGYLPDTFGHNNQSPQILKMNGINNISFYRGLDPKATDDKLYFTYKGQDGSEIFGHWQTHYSTNAGAFDYTTKAFEEHIVADYTEPGKFGPSVHSYAKRNLGLPIAIPVGSDQRPMNKSVKGILKDLNAKYEDYNFIPSDYETMINAAVKQIKEEGIELPVVTSELRAALTGRVHRTVGSSRADIKQKLFDLESTLIDVLEPLSIMCLVNDIDVPWDMITHVWKEVFKSSAHDSYGTTNEDVVNTKLKNRLTEAQRVAEGVVAMLSRIYSSKIVKEKEDSYNKLVLFNFDKDNYSGLYEFQTTVKRKYEDGKFKIMDGDKEVKFSIVDRNNVGTHERDALKLVVQVKDVPAFSHKIFDIVYAEEVLYEITKDNKISCCETSVEVLDNELKVVMNGKEYPELFKLAMDPSVGDTYDHSPVTHNDEKYILKNFEVLETNVQNSTIRFTAKTECPSGYENWIANKVSGSQKATVQITIVEGDLHIKVFVENTSLNGRMIMLVDSQSNSDKWAHNTQFGMYERNLINEHMSYWEGRDKLGYKWDEYPTNLSAQQSFITNNERDFTVFTHGSREHEMIEFDGKKQFAITMYRALDKFGRSTFLYRPGRGSGAKCDAPDCQMLEDKLEYTFVIKAGKLSTIDQFKFAKQIDKKNFYIPGQWALDRTILRWDTEIDFFDEDKKHRAGTVLVPEAIQNSDFVRTALYKAPDGKIIARYLNLGDKTTVTSDKQGLSRELTDFSNKTIEVPTYGLINVLVKG